MLILALWETTLHISYSGVSAVIQHMLSYCLPEEKCEHNLQRVWSCWHDLHCCCACFALLLYMPVHVEFSDQTVVSAFTSTPLTLQLSQHQCQILRHYSHLFVDAFCWCRIGGDRGLSRGWGRSRGRGGQGDHSSVVSHLRHRHQLPLAPCAHPHLLHLRVTCPLPPQCAQVQSSSR